MAYNLSNMTLFKRVDAGQVIISERGLYRQVDLYERDGQLFAAHKNGFVRLLDRENTTIPYVTWKAIEGVEYTSEYNGPKAKAADGVRLATAA